MNWAFHSSERTCLRLVFSAHQSLKVNALVPSFLNWLVTQPFITCITKCGGHKKISIRKVSENSTKLNFKKKKNMHIMVLLTCVVPCDITVHHVMSLKPWFWAHTRYALHWACHHTSQHNCVCPWFTFKTTACYELCVFTAHATSYALIDTEWFNCGKQRLHIFLVSSQRMYEISVSLDSIVLGCLTFKIAVWVVNLSFIEFNSSKNFDLRSG